MYIVDNTVKPFFGRATCFYLYNVVLFVRNLLTYFLLTRRAAIVTMQQSSNREDFGDLGVCLEIDECTLRRLEEHNQDGVDGIAQFGAIWKKHHLSWNVSRFDYRNGFVQASLVQISDQDESEIRYESFLKIGASVPSQRGRGILWSVGSELVTHVALQVHQLLRDAGFCPVAGSPGAEQWMRHDDGGTVTFCEEGISVGNRFAQGKVRDLTEAFLILGIPFPV